MNTRPSTDSKLQHIYEGEVRNTGQMGAPDASQIDAAINQNSGAGSHIYTPNEYRIGENEEGETSKSSKIREGLKKIKEILDNLDL